MPRNVTEKRAAFRALHASGCFLLPNPWDAGSARYLEHLGFKALATTSSGFAWSTGHADNTVSRDAVLAHLREIVAATDLPVNADFEDGFGADPLAVAKSVSMAVDTGIAGLSIEDSSRDPKSPLLPIPVAVQRIAAARAAIDATGGDTLLIGRAESSISSNADLEDTIARLKAYSQAGADCLYAPGIQTREQIEAVLAAVTPKPVNVLIGGPSALTLVELAELGVRRVSVGGALARAAWGGFMDCAQALREGHFDRLPNAPSGGTLNGLFRTTQ